MVTALHSQMERISDALNSLELIIFLAELVNPLSPARRESILSKSHD